MTEAQAEILPPEPVAGIGHNLAPDDVRIRENLDERYKSLLPRGRQLIEDAAAIPEEIPEAIATQVADFLRALRQHIVNIKAAKRIEKEPYLSGAAVVEAFFSNMREPLEELKNRVAIRYEKTLRLKEQRLRREAEERARVEREKAEAERKRKEAEAREQAERLAEQKRIADEAEARRKREAEEAEARRQDEARAAAYALVWAEAELENATFDREAREREVAADNARKDAELRRLRAQEEKAKRDAEKRRQDEAEATKRAEVQRQEQERRAQQQRDAEADAIKRQEKIVTKADQRVEQAEERQTAAEALERKVSEEPAARFARTRGEYGGLGTLRETMTFANIDRATIDLERLRSHIPFEALEQAVRGFIAAGGTELNGVDIFPENKLVMR